VGVYYRERKELINPKLRALEKKKKITKPPAFARAPKTNQIINFGARPVQSIRVFCACAQNQSCNQLWGALTLITRQHAAPSPLFIAWGSPPSSFVYQLTTSPSLLSRQGPTHPSTPFVHGGLGVRPLASVWTFGDNAGRQTEVWIKHVFISVHKFQWLWRKLHSKFSVFQCGQVERCRHAVLACPPGCL
jgi:hypothetical protein